jgi:3-hydroxypropanoate dehydrogenase
VTLPLSTATLFTAARTPGGYRDTPVADDTLRALYELLKWGPTSANCSPARFVFVRSAAARERLAACVSAGNVEKVRAAPVTVIVGMAMDFTDALPRLYPQTDARAWFAGKPALVETTAMRNSSLQGGYLILAARALRLDAGPMSGFEADKVDAAFWAGTAVKTNFICALGHADPAQARPRNPRLAFDEACRLA